MTINNSCIEQYLRNALNVALGLSLACMATACVDGNGFLDDDGAGDGPSVTTGVGTTTAGDDTDTGTDGEAFQFDEAPPEAYARVDRMGQPAVATVLIESKNAYNEADPVDDVAGMFVDEITSAVTRLHEALDDEFMALGLTPCMPEGCLEQAAPFVIPDTVRVDLTAPADFPNGRRLEDPVIDRILALLFLDLSQPGIGLETLVEVPVNPPRNDREFSTEFPYLAEPN